MHPVQRLVAALHRNHGQSSAFTPDLKKVKDKDRGSESAQQHILVRALQVQRICVREPDRFQGPELSPNQRLL